MVKDTFNNPFDKLKGVKLSKKQKKAPVKPPEPKPAELAPEDEGDLFLQAMSGVGRLDGKLAGRQVVTPVKPGASPSRIDPDAEATSKLYDLVSGKVEFELEYTDEYVQGFVRGLDSKIFRQLKAGQFSPEGHFDLHGLNAEQAQMGVLQFMREQYYLGKRCLLWCPAGASIRRAACRCSRKNSRYG